MRGERGGDVSPVAFIKAVLTEHHGSNRPELSTGNAIFPAPGIKGNPLGFAGCDIHETRHRHRRCFRRAPRCPIPTIWFVPVPYVLPKSFGICFKNK